MSAKAHVLFALVTLGSLIFIVRLVRRRELHPKYSFLWLAIGTLMVILSVSPKILDSVSIWLGISYGPTTLFMSAIVLLLLISVHFSWELSRLEERTRVLAEELALIDSQREPSRGT